MTPKQKSELNALHLQFEAIGVKYPKTGDRGKATKNTKQFTKEGNIIDIPSGALVKILNVRPYDLLERLCDCELDAYPGEIFIFFDKDLEITEVL